MISSVGNAGGAGLVVVMKEATTAQDVDFAVLKKSQDVEKANGEAALKLITSAAATSSTGRVDVHV